MSDRDFCERSWKLVYVLLVVLVLATGVWAFVGMRTARAAGPASAGQDAGRGPASGASDGASAAAPDGITMATPKGGLNLIAGAGATLSAIAGSSLQGAFNAVSARIQPTVVNIKATRSGAAAFSRSPREGLGFMRPPDGGPNPGPSKPAFESVGAGVIIDARGFILTNHHVISGAQNILVSVFGGISQEFPATVVAADPRNDLALLKVTGAPPLAEATLGDSDGAQVGDCVLAFGSPFGLDQTVTQGIISSKRKALVVEGITYGDMLQTDAPINRGSSGGPLVNMSGEVIGMNTAIYGPGGVFSGTGFAIPINRAKIFLASAKEVLLK